MVAYFMLHIIISGESDPPGSGRTSRSLIKFQTQTDLKRSDAARSDHDDAMPSAIIAAFMGVKIGRVCRCRRLLHPPPPFR